jgi:hypothetical protein
MVEDSEVRVATRAEVVMAEELAEELAAYCNGSAKFNSRMLI